MVKAMVQISDDANQILNIVKAKHNLRDKSEAIDRVVLEYGQDFLKLELRPEFVQKMKERQNEPTVKINNFRKHFGL